MSRPQNIAILGGSFLQKEFALTAKKAGHNVFILDGNPNCYLSKNIAGEFHNINFSKEDEVLQFCKINDVAFVYAPSNEIGNLVASRLAKAIGFNYNKEETVITTLNKLKQRDLLKGLRFIKSPKSITYQGNDELISSRFEYPVVVKPSGSSASRGVSSADDKSKLKKAIENARQYLNDGDDIIIEEYVGGVQLSIESLSVNGEHYIAGITKEIVSGPPDFIERSHFMGPKIHSKYYHLLIDPVNELLTAAKVAVGPCHIELKIQNNNIYLIEIASRAGGLRDYLMKISGYPDYSDLILSAYLSNYIDEDKLQPPKQNGLVNIMTRVNDLYSFINGKKTGKLDSYYLNDIGPVPEPKNLIDAFGYAYFKSQESLSKFSLR